jgi:hypothetical protein
MQNYEDDEPMQSENADEGNAQDSQNQIPIEEFEKGEDLENERF